jgi:hypothetical protein
MLVDCSNSGSLCIYNIPMFRPQQYSLLPGEKGIISSGAVTLMLMFIGFVSWLFTERLKLALVLLLISPNFSIAAYLFCALTLTLLKLFKRLINSGLNIMMLALIFRVIYRSMLA